MLSKNPCTARQQRMKRALEIYKEENDKLDAEIKVYNEAYAKWEIEAKPTIEENKNRRANFLLDLPLPPRPPSPNYEGPSNRTYVRIIEEMDLSDRKVKEYIKLCILKLENNKQ